MRLLSFLCRYGRRKAAAAGTARMRRYAPALLQPLTPGFWFHHPLKALYLFVFWKSLRFSWHLLRKYLQK